MEKLQSSNGEYRITITQEEREAIEESFGGEALENIPDYEVMEVLEDMRRG